MSEDGLDKQHQASGKRIADLRRKGQTMRSKDLVSGLVFIISILMILVMASKFKKQIVINFSWSFKSIANVLDDNKFPSEFLSTIIMNNFSILIPLFVMSFTAAIISPFIFGGWNFTLHALGFNLDKINPFRNFGNIFSKRIFIEMLRSSIKLTIISSVMIYFAYSKKIDIFHLTNLPLLTALNDGVLLIEEFIICLSISLILIVVLDVLYNKYEYQNKTKMSSQELKDEYKETEGSADVKRKIRSKQLELFKQRLTLVVPKATVIITNPTHYAIALRYDENNDKAPKVVAKGKGFVAQQIRNIAITSSVPIYQAPELARAIYHTTKINAGIHPGLYMSVAIVLSYIHQLKNYQLGIGRQPQYVSDLQIPNEFIYEE